MRTPELGFIGRRDVRRAEAMGLSKFVPIDLQEGPLAVTGRRQVFVNVAVDERPRGEVIADMNVPRGGALTIGVYPYNWKATGKWVQIGMVMSTGNFKPNRLAEGILQYV